MVGRKWIRDLVKLFEILAHTGALSLQSFTAPHFAYPSVIGLLQLNWWSRDIVTTKTMRNHNIIYRNEKNRSKLVILQSVSLLFRKWEHFQTPNLIEFIWVEGKPCSPGTISHTNLLNIYESSTAPKSLYFNADLKLGSSTYFCLLFPFLVFTKSQVVNLRVGRSRAHCCKRPNNSSLVQ